MKQDSTTPTTTSKTSSASRIKMRRFFTIFFVLVLLSLQLGELFHTLVKPHFVCPVDGQITHSLHTNHEIPSQESNALSDATDDISIVRNSLIELSDLGDSADSDDLCPIMSIVRLGLRKTTIGVLKEQGFTHRLIMIPELPDVLAKEPIYRSAPKNSPPTFC